MGVYGLLSVMVVSRRAEIGLRMASGATRAVTLALVGAMAAALPSWRASRLDPARTLRGEG